MYGIGHTMLRCPSQDAGERGGIPDRLDGSILGLSPLESHQSLGMVGLYDLDLLHFHLDIMEFLVERRVTGIHAQADLSGRATKSEAEERWIDVDGGYCTITSGGRRATCTVGPRGRRAWKKYDRREWALDRSPIASDSACVPASRPPCLDV